MYCPIRRWTQISKFVSYGPNRRIWIVSCQIILQNQWNEAVLSTFCVRFMSGMNIKSQNNWAGVNCLWISAKIKTKYDSKWIKQSRSDTHEIWSSTTCVLWLDISDAFDCVALRSQCPHAGVHVVTHGIEFMARYNAGKISHNQYVFAILLGGEGRLLFQFRSLSMLSQSPQYFQSYCPWIAEKISVRANILNINRCYLVVFGTPHTGFCPTK